MELVNELNPNLWKTIAGYSVQIPTVDSLVYYFPQGHAEQASTAPDFTLISKKLTHSFFVCRIVSVKLLANKETDEVFAKIRLKPIDYYHPLSCVGTLRLSNGSLINDDNNNNNNGLTSFAKVLTISDANNGGGFSVPKHGAESVFPTLDTKGERPAQSLKLRDVHGVEWEIRHIFRGTPLRHLLTTGWSRFVNHKKLVGGDTVVFIKHSNGELSVGIRRKVFPVENVDVGRWNLEGSYQNLKKEECKNGEILSFQRNARSRVSAESVLKAVELAEQNCEFEVSWYPKLGSTDFLVNCEIVNESMNMNWNPGFSIKMLVEKEGSSATWCQGKVSSIGAENGLWRGSPWRMLQVTWDDNKGLQNVTSVSPWQVHVITPPYPPSKKQCASQAEFLPDGKGASSFHLTESSNFVIGSKLSSSPTSPLVGYNTFPVCMQGARHTPIYRSNLDLCGNNNNHISYNVPVSDNNVSSKTSDVAINLNSESSASQFGNNTNNILFPDNVTGSPLSTESRSVNNGGILQSDRFSFSSQESVNPLSNSSSKPFKLFGQIISSSQSVETKSDDGGSPKADGGVKWGCRDDQYTGLSLTTE